MALTILDITNGIFSIIFVVISIIIGLTIMAKYFAYKQRTYLLIGLTWIGMASTWTPSSISLVVFLTLGMIPPIQLLLFIAIFFLPFAQAFWITVFCVFKGIKSRKIVIGLFVIEGIIFEAFFLLLLFTNPSAIATFSATFDMDYALWINIFLFSLLIMFLATGTSLAWESVKSDDPEVKLKGKFLFIAFYSFIVGAVLDIFSASSIFILTVARLVLISSAFAFYVGFILPDWMKKLFLS
ncbi:MAG: hypothetical protein GF383_10485 [Candidatus Lokiarchaeota archaeon]|nr:hypothetical protein [Candidatus Lokiarchaeota archaeon]MBD3340999.1 hypothetical protein [Candidatus Lokiarchaeota archaeon]